MGHRLIQLTRAGMVAVIAAMFAACVFPMPAKTQIDRSGDVRRSSAPLGVAVVFSRDFAAATSNSLGHAMVKCGRAG